MSKQAMDFWFFFIILGIPCILLVGGLFYYGWKDYKNEQPDVFGRTPVQRPKPLRPRNRNRG